MKKPRPTLWQRLKRLFFADEAMIEPSPNLTNIIAPASANPDGIASQITANSPTDTTPVAVRTHTASREPALLLAQPEDTATQTPPMSELPPEWLDTPPILVTEIEAVLEQLGYQFVYHPVSAEDEQPVHHFTMQVSDEQHEWGCMIRYFSEQQLMAVYSIFPFNVPNSHRADMLAVLSYLNYDLMIGNLELDLNDGELRFKTSLDLEVTGGSDAVLSYLLQSNFSLVSRLYATLEAVIKKPIPATDLDTAVQELMQAEQEKTFFVMSDTIQ